MTTKEAERKHTEIVIDRKIWGKSAIYSQIIQRAAAPCFKIYIFYWGVHKLPQYTANHATFQIQIRLGGGRIRGRGRGRGRVRNYGN